MPSYTPPQFNLTAFIWHTGHAPPADPHDVTADCQLYYPRQDMMDLTPDNTGLWRAPMYARFPAGTDVRFQPGMTGAQNYVEIPGDSGRLYLVCQVDDAHKGFPNEYRVALLQPTGTWPEPIP